MADAPASTDAFASPDAPAAAPVAAPLPPPAAVRVLLKALGGAPQLRRTRFRCDAAERLAAVGRFLRLQLALADEAPLFLYVLAGRGADAAHFIPAPDDTVGELARRSAAPAAAAVAGGGAGAPEPEIVISYAVAPAFA